MRRHLSMLILFLVTIIFKAVKSCDLDDQSKKEIEDEYQADELTTVSVLFSSTLFVFLVYIFLGYLLAGYHFYEQICHDAEDDEERKVREERIQKIMKEQDILWQMKKARDQRKMKEEAAAEAERAMKKLTEKKKLITIEEHESEIRERQVNEQKLQKRVKESERRVLELEATLEKYKMKEKKRIQQIQVHKPTKKIPEGHKLLSGAAKPINPKSTEPKAIALEKPLAKRDSEFKPASPLRRRSPSKQLESSIAPNMGSIDEEKPKPTVEKETASVEPKIDGSKKAPKTDKKESKSSNYSDTSDKDKE